MTSEFVTRKDTYNIIGGGYGGGFCPTDIRKKISNSLRGTKASEETKTKQRLAHLGKKNHFYGRQHSKETRQKMSALCKDKYVGEDNPFYGHTQTELTRNKISNAHKGKTLTDEHKQILRELNSGVNNKFYGKKHSIKMKIILATIKVGEQVFYSRIEDIHSSNKEYGWKRALAKRWEVCPQSAHRFISKWAEYTVASILEIMADNN